MKQECAIFIFIVHMLGDPLRFVQCTKQFSANYNCTHSSCLPTQVNLSMRLHTVKCQTANKKWLPLLFTVIESRHTIMNVTNTSERTEHTATIIQPFTVCSCLLVFFFLKYIWSKTKRTYYVLKSRDMPEDNKKPTKYIQRYTQMYMKVTTPKWICISVYYGI